MSGAHFDLNLFRVFNAVMTSGGVSAAAEQLEMTPAAISQAITRLSNQIGEPLFVRLGRGITPTARALSLHRETSDSLHTMERAIRQSEQFIPATSQRYFRIASHPDLDMMLLPPLLRTLTEQAPRCRLESVASLLDEPSRLQALRLHNIDLVLSSTPHEEKGFCSELLLEYPTRVVCRRDHPRIGDHLEMADFFTEEHVVWDVRRRDDWVVRTLAHVELPPRNIAYESNALLSALVMVGQTDWLTITSSWHLALVSDALALKGFPIPWPSDDCPLYMCWHQSQDQDPGLNWLQTQIRQQCRAIQFP